MASLQRSLSYGGGDADKPSPLLRQRSKRLSIAASLMSLIRKPDSPPPPDSPGAAEHEEIRKKQEEAWMQACYNAVTLLFMFITGCICVAVYYVLESFLHPLLWAVLVGTFLHPLKHNSTVRIRQWLESLETNSVPLSVGIVLSPVLFFNGLAEFIEYRIVYYWRSRLYIMIVIVSIWVAYSLNLPLHVYNATTVLSAGFQTVDSVMSSTAIFQFCTVVVGFATLVFLSRRSEHTTAMKILAAILWFLVILNVGTHLAGRIALPGVIVLFVAGTITTQFWKAGPGEGRLGREPNGAEESKEDGEGDTLERGITLKTARSVSVDRCGANTPVDIERSGLPQQSTIRQDATPSPGSVPSEDAGVVAEAVEDAEEPVETDRQIRTGGTTAEREKRSQRMPRVSFGGSTAVEMSPTADSPPSGLREVAAVKEHADSKKPGARPSGAHQVKLPPGSETGEEEVDGRVRRTAFRTNRTFAHARAKTNKIFLSLSMACIVVFFWKYPLFLLLVTPIVVWCAVKLAITHTDFLNAFLGRLHAARKSAKNWINLRYSVFFPPPLPTLLRLLSWADGKFLHGVKQSVGNLMSACIIVGLLGTGLASAVLLLFEMQVELSHYVSVSVTVWNRTMAGSPQLAEWMGTTNNSLHSTLESFASHGYTHLRQWLAWQINSLVADPGGNTSQKLLDLFDKLYQSYVLQNTSVDIHLGSTLGELQATHRGHLLWSELRTIASENAGTIMSVLQSVWYILSENMSLALSFLYTLLQLLFSGGTALLNMVVFITALFYLLCYSEEHYLPVTWVTGLLPHLMAEDSGGSYEKAFSRAIRSVFDASLRRALFYGFYTWLIHTTFDLPVSILPSVLAAIAGAIPFIGPYWVTVPAVLELWLVEGQVVMALVVLALSLLPLFVFVDTLIYSEIEGGHPYLTGLAIAGGIYLAGLEGALIGPILLCCLLFVMELYGDMLNYDY